MAMEHATGWPDRHATTRSESAASAHGDVMLILLKILAVWTVISVVGGFAIAPALSRRLRDINFRRDDH